MDVKSDTERQIMQGNGQGLLEFLDRCGERGDMNAATARAFRATAKSILSVEPVAPVEIDVRTLNVDDLLERFANRRKGDYSDGSLETYRSRFRRGIGMYLGWLDDDPNWKNAGPPSAASRQPTRRNNSTRKPSTKAHSVAEREVVETVAATSASSDGSLSESGVRLMTYDFALRPDLIVRVTLPVDLTTEDADRFASFVRVLAWDPHPR
jgi:hypothetical protein